MTPHQLKTKKKIQYEIEIDSFYPTSDPDENFRPSFYQLRMP